MPHYGFHYDFSPQGDTARDFGRERLSDNDFHDRPDHMRTLTAIDDTERVWAQDFLGIAKAAHLADRRSPRRLMLDGWTRTITLSVQVGDPDRWSDKQLTTVNELLQLLTGDQWDVRVRGGAAIHPTLPGDRWATHVALFSGGLDSTAYAAHLARRLSRTQRAVFVAYDWNLQTPQRHVFTAIENIAGKRVHLHQVRLRPRANGEKLDGSNRSRSLLFIATAVCVAAIHRVSQAIVPENGQLAVSPALTPGRLSACSTRSVHPWALHLINSIIAGIGGDVTVTNPFLHHTKGDICREALDAGLTADILSHTVSCGHPTTARAHHNTAYHCGHCFPCLVRRAGLDTALNSQPDLTNYRTDIADLNPLDHSDNQATDLRDLALWLAHDFTTHDLLADAPLPLATTPDTLMPMLQRGRHELTTMITRHANLESPLRRTWTPALE